AGRLRCIQGGHGAGWYRDIGEDEQNTMSQAVVGMFILAHAGPLLPSRSAARAAAFAPSPATQGNPRIEPALSHGPVGVLPPFFSLWNPDFIMQKSSIAMQRRTFHSEIFLSI